MNRYPPGRAWDCHDIGYAPQRRDAESQKNSRRLWRSRRRKSSSVPAGAANFPAAVFLAGKCPNLGRDSISRCRKIGESFSSSVEICRKTFPAGNFGQPQPSRVFWESCPAAHGRCGVQRCCRMKRPPLAWPMSYTPLSLRSPLAGFATWSVANLPTSTSLLNRCVTSRFAWPAGVTAEWKDPFRYDLVSWRMAKVGAQKRGFENALFNLKNALKPPCTRVKWAPWFFNSGGLQGFFMAQLPWKMHEKQLKNAWKTLDFKIKVVFSGGLQIPPFVPPSVCRSQSIIVKQFMQSGFNTRLKSVRNPLNSCVSEGAGRTLAGPQRQNRLHSSQNRLHTCNFLFLK